MDKIEHLQRIRAKCVELLEIAGKRTPGKWKAGGKYDRDYVSAGVWDDEVFCTGHRYNAAFIAACAGRAEAGWRNTIDEIDELMPHVIASESKAIPPTVMQAHANRRSEKIKAAWPEELL